MLLFTFLVTVLIVSTTAAEPPEETMKMVIVLPYNRTINNLQRLYDILPASVDDRIRDNLEKVTVLLSKFRPAPPLFHRQKRSWHHLLGPGPLPLTYKLLKAGNFTSGQVWAGGSGKNRQKRLVLPIVGLGVLISELIRSATASVVKESATMEDILKGGREDGEMRTLLERDSESDKVIFPPVYKQFPVTKYSFELGNARHKAG